jgi:2-dehydro-3-deoxyphosphogluconate aldolase/(4S)-4-hydroxy-2-oxoglutarate aldolase
MVVRDPDEDRGHSGDNGYGASGSAFTSCQRLTGLCRYRTKGQLMLKLKVLGRILDSGLVVVVRAEKSDEALRIAEACADGGAAAVEITFTIPRAAHLIEDVSRRDFARGMAIGAGTVLDPETARIAILSGAQFVVSPALNPETARLCNRYQIPYIPGAATVREIVEAMECGAEIVKVFPGEILNPAFVKAVMSAIPHASLMPTGGVSLENVSAWFAAGCVAVGVGGNLTRAAGDGDFRSITELTRRFIEEIRRSRT